MLTELPAVVAMDDNEGAVLEAKSVEFLPNEYPASVGPAAVGISSQTSTQHQWVQQQ